MPRCIYLSLRASMSTTSCTSHTASSSRFFLIGSINSSNKPKSRDFYNLLRRALIGQQGSPHPWQGICVLFLLPKNCLLFGISSTRTGPHVFHGAFSTFLATVVFADASITFIHLFFKVLFKTTLLVVTLFQVMMLLVSVGLFHALVSMPVLLSVLGPSAIHQL